MMLKNLSISTKFVLAVVPLIFLALGTSAYLNNRYQEQDMLEQAQASAQTYAELIRKSLVEQMVTKERIDDEYLKLLGSGGDIDSLHIYFITDSLHLRDIYQSEDRFDRLRKREEESHMNAHTHPVFLTGAPTWSRKGQVLNAIIPFKAVARCQQCHEVPQDHVLGVAEMDISLTPLAESIKKNWIRSLAVFLTFTLIVIISSLLLYRVLIARNLKRLLEATKQIGNGNLEIPLTGQPSHDELGQLGAAFETMRVRLKKAQEKIILSERLSTIGQMASSIVHDFRTPMTSINLAIESLRLGKESPPEKTQQWYRIIHDGIQRMATMAQELLDFSRGEIRLHKVEISVDMFVILLVQSVKTSLEQSKVQLRVSNNCKRMARFDTERLLRAFVNLITNAQDAMPQGGEIRVTIDEHDKLVRLVVTDTGTGIPPEIKGRIFEAFVTAGKKKGTGLGLAITKRIIDQHGGSIEVKSERGKGTSVTFEIPVF